MAKHGKVKHYGKQHFVAQCYMKAWHDPGSSVGKRTPYVWVFDRDGKNSKPRAPSNLFTETDIYTLALGDIRNVELEHGLQELEDKYTRIRNKTFLRINGLILSKSRGYLHLFQRQIRAHEHLEIFKLSSG